MASTRTHDISCIILSLFQFAIAALIKEPILAYSGIGSLIGLLLSPDLDWNGAVAYMRYKDGTKSKTYIITRLASDDEYIVRDRIYSRVCRRWPVPLRGWWGLFALIMNHRGLSHWPIAGTLVRLLWIFPLTVLPTFFFPLIFIPIWLGLLYSDIVHIVLDRF